MIGFRGRRVGEDEGGYCKIAPPPRPLFCSLALAILLLPPLFGVMRKIVPYSSREEKTAAFQQTLVGRAVAKGGGGREDRNPSCGKKCPFPYCTLGVLYTYSTPVCLRREGNFAEIGRRKGRLKERGRRTFGRRRRRRRDFAGVFADDNDCDDDDEDAWKKRRGETLEGRRKRRRGVILCPSLWRWWRRRRREEQGGEKKERKYPSLLSSSLFCSMQAKVFS